MQNFSLQNQRIKHFPNFAEQFFFFKFLRSNLAEKLKHSTKKTFLAMLENFSQVMHCTTRKILRGAICSVYPYYIYYRPWLGTWRKSFGEVRRNQLVLESGISWSLSLGPVSPRSRDYGVLKSGTSLAQSQEGPVGPRVRDKMVQEAGTSWS